ncbi:MULTISPECIES: PLD nuclease N-terminal domain-containing protein [unclassified Streptomyces]|uniref:PLD nuclease N-terminal domain-containing protein n=1 Tax=Streptomycetaceae TaxID=2062 RepID=UPI002E78A24B|nr:MULTISPECIES: PLD nuclease N-terminal domain-containing protein [unclassified Streptomyces]MED7951625.1 PLD nuclease N-terminal domain-containing protein [Streptomyces sp. BE303]MEE1829038.1 PLD nuclease N-terminal domain-containing protein [Streptomyces sp. BE20]
MLRILTFVLPLALWVWAFIDCLTTPEDEVKHLPKVVWVIIVLLFPLVGSIAWLVAGKQRNAPRTAGAGRHVNGDGGSGFDRPRGGRPLAPDDDPEFLASLKKDDKKHEDMLKQWEADLRRREEELRGREDPEDGRRS